MVTTGQVLVYCINLSPPIAAVPLQDFVVAETIDGSSSEITYWNTAKLGAQPSQATFDAITQSQVDTYYRTAAKAAATNSIDLNPGYQQRAIALMAIQEINALRDWITSFKSAVAAATSLANLQSRVAGLADMPDRTLSQAKQSYKNLLAGTTLDE